MSERYIPEHRRNQFKAKSAFKPDELRRRREEQQVEIRKAKREENLAKRRGIAPPEMEALLLALLWVLLSTVMMRAGLSRVKYVFLFLFLRSTL